MPFWIRCGAHSKSGNRSERPYLAARLRVLLARACVALSDVEGADSQLEGAAEVFERFGALPDLAALARNLRRSECASSAARGHLRPDRARAAGAPAGRDAARPTRSSRASCRSATRRSIATSATSSRRWMSPRAPPRLPSPISIVSSELRRPGANYPCRLFPRMGCSPEVLLPLSTVGLPALPPRGASHDDRPNDDEPGSPRTCSRKVGRIDGARATERVTQLRTRKLRRGRDRRRSGRPLGRLSPGAGRRSLRDPRRQRAHRRHLAQALGFAAAVHPGRSSMA